MRARSARWLGLLLLSCVTRPSSPHGAGDGCRASVACTARPLLRIRGGDAEGGGLRPARSSGLRTADEMDVEIDGDQEAESAVKRRTQARRADPGSALVFPSQQAVQKSEQVQVGETDSIFSMSLQYHCHNDKVVKARSAEEAVQRRLRKDQIEAERERAKEYAEAADGLLGLQGVQKSKQTVQKRTSINCSLAIEHGLFNATELADFLRQRIKFNNQLHNLAGALSVEVEGHDVVVQAYRATQMKRKRIFERKMVLADAFSTRYLRYLMKKFIVHKELKDFVRPVSVDFSRACQERGGTGVRFEIRYTSIHKDKHLRLKMARKYGTRLEMARRAMMNEAWADEDAHKVQVPRHEMLMERKIKATGERVGGEDWEESRNLLKHWVDLQHKTYRAPFGGAMRDWGDKSITRHNPDRVGKRSHGTAGYTAVKGLRSRSGTRLGIESLLYTGTAPDGIKGVRKRAISQKMCDRAQKAHYRASKVPSRQGDADRTIYNWKPKWLFAGKMDLHKRDRR